MLRGIAPFDPVGACERGVPPDAVRSKVGGRVAVERRQDPQLEDARPFLPPIGARVKEERHNLVKVDSMVAQSLQVLHLRSQSARLVAVAGHRRHPQVLVVPLANDTFNRTQVDCPGAGLRQAGRNPIGENKTQELTTREAMRA